MTYHCGIGDSMSLLGFMPCEPHITCDGCGVTAHATKRSGEPYAWLLAGKPPPKWKQLGAADRQTHWCPECVAAGKVGAPSMTCPNRRACSDWICLCYHPLDGSQINTWLSTGHRCYKLQPHEDRKAVIRILEEEANHAYGMWMQTC